jgi:hypothetical protein
VKVKLHVATNAVKDQTDWCAFLTFHEAKRLASSTASNLLADGAMIDIAPAYDSSSEKVCVRVLASDECVRALDECALHECPQARHRIFRMLLCISAVKQFCIRANREKKWCSSSVFSVFCIRANMEKCEEHTELGALEYVAK